MSWQPEEKFPFVYEMHRSVKCGSRHLGLWITDLVTGYVTYYPIYACRIPRYSREFGIVMEPPKVWPWPPKASNDGVRP